MIIDSIDQQIKQVLERHYTIRLAFLFGALERVRLILSLP